MKQSQSPRREIFRQLSLKKCAVILLGSAIMAFGLYNIHAISQVTEGGVLGMELLLRHWFGISPAVSEVVISGLCYAFGYKVLGKRFIAYSAVAAGGFSLAYLICEQFPPVYPAIAEMPLAAALAGAVFIGVGAGLCVRCGGAPGGDDALAMTLAEKTGIRIQWIYLISDLTVLGLSLTYVPWQRLLYSLLTVVLSGQILGYVVRAKIPERFRRKKQTEQK